MPWDAFIVELTGAEVVEGKSCKLVAQTSLNGRTFMWFRPEVTWYRNEEDLLRLDGRVRAQQGAEGFFELAIDRAEMADQGTYTIRLAYATGIIKDSAKLTVKRGSPFPSLHRRGAAHR